MYKSLLTLLFILSSVAMNFAQTAAAKTDAIPQEVKTHVDALIEAGVNTGIVIGVLDADGEHFYSKGVRSMKTGVPVDENSVFEIGSISKTFTCTILADMVKEGKMKLDDPLQKYMPKGITVPTRNGKEITLVSMANHTSALPRMPSNFDPADNNNPYADYTERLLYEFLNGYELTRDIGSQFEYSNYAMGLLGYTLAQQNEMTYAELLKKRITGPLGMNNTDIVCGVTMKANLAKGHSGLEEVSNWDLATLAGAGAIRSTASDMLKYLAANMKGINKNLKPAVQLAHKKSTMGEDLPDMGLGWFIQEVNGMPALSHGGATGGYRAFAGFLKDGNKAVVVLTNSTANVENIGQHLFDSTVALKEVKRLIANDLKVIIDKEGIRKGKETYRKLRADKSEDYEWDEGDLNNLGYSYLNKGEMDKAIAVFQLNIEAYPEESNPYDSMGEAYMKNEDKEKAIKYYKKSIELNPGNQNGIDMLKKMGVDVSDLVKEVKVDAKIMKSYVGKYQLTPAFFITVTHEDGGLHIQATGQSKFPVFPKSETRFYLKVVEADIEFYPSEDGKVDKMTLFQNGAEMKGLRVKD